MTYTEHLYEYERLHYTSICFRRLIWLDDVFYVTAL